MMCMLPMPLNIWDLSRTYTKKVLQLDRRCEGQNSVRRSNPKLCNMGAPVGSICHGVDFAQRLVSKSTCANLHHVCQTFPFTWIYVVSVHLIPSTSYRLPGAMNFVLCLEFTYVDKHMLSLVKCLSRISSHDWPYIVRNSVIYPKPSEPMSVKWSWSFSGVERQVEHTNPYNSQDICIESGRWALYIYYVYDTRCIYKYM